MTNSTRPAFVALAFMLFMSSCASTPSERVDRLVRAHEVAEREPGFGTKSPPVNSAFDKAMSRERLDVDESIAVAEEAARRQSLPEFRDQWRAISDILASLANRALVRGDRVEIRAVLTAGCIQGLGPDPIELAIVEIGDGPKDPSKTLGILVDLATTGSSDEIRSIATAALRRGLGSVLPERGLDDAQFVRACGDWVSAHETVVNEQYYDVWMRSGVGPEPVVMSQSVVLPKGLNEARDVPSEGR